MKFTSLEPQFLTYEVTPGWPTQIANDPLNFPKGGSRIEFRDKVTFHEVDTIEKAQGVMFLCPKCYKEKGGPRGTHSVLCWSRSRGVPDDAHPGPGRWTLEGTGYHDLTLGAEPPETRRSVQSEGGCRAHFHVTNGEVTDA